MRDVPASQFQSRFPVEKQRQNFDRQQALALDAAGWVLARLGRVEEAEAKLRRSIELDRTEAGLTHLASVLKQGGRTGEADTIAVELNARLAESVKKDLISRPAKDFQLPDANGRQYRLSDLKGKIVLVSTWATWCGPCVAEMPLFVETYEKYKERGLEILAIADDDPADRDRVLQFVRDRYVSFPVLYDTGTVARLHELEGYPGNIFIDRQGNVRYAKVGGFDDMRRLEFILNELLK